MRANEPVNYIFTSLWSTGKDLAVKDIAYMSVVYSVLLVDRIDALLEATSSMIDLNETVIFDASSSQFKNGNKTGLVFSWLCPEVFQDYCDLFFGIDKLEISPSAFR